MAIYRASFIHSRTDGDDTVLTGHWQDTAGGATVDQVAEDLGTAYEAFLADDSTGPGSTETVDYFAEGVAFYRCTAQAVNSPGSPVGEYVPGSPVTSGATTSLPAQVCLCVTRRSAFNSRRGRGRFYFGPLAASAQVWNSTGNGFAANFPVSVPARWEGNMQSITGTYDTWDEMIWSTVLTLGFPVISYNADTRPDTQRRRL